ncbi:BPSL0067 family protein [Dolichospermum sp. UHCC 0259]|nr:BPSL0067 family protein [Dolichospermum sp. UHCC 0259]
MVSIAEPILMTTGNNLTKLINGDFDGKYIEADGAFLYQCVDLVKDMTDTETTVTEKWKRGENVIQNRNVAVGTAIATFKGSNNSYYGHAAIFGGYDTVNDVFGFWAWSQNFPTGSAVRKHFVPITGSGSENNDADEYYVIKL